MTIEVEDPPLGQGPRATNRYTPQGHRRQQRGIVSHSPYNLF